MELNVRRLKFAVGWISREEFERITLVADYISYDKARKCSIYRLNLEKCRKLGVEKAKEILRKHGIRISESLAEILEKAEKPFVILNLKGSDLIIYGLYKTVPELSGLLMWDDIDKIFRSKPCNYHKIYEILKQKGYHVVSTVRENWDLDVETKLTFKLRPYQLESFKAWQDNNYRGVIVLPTGAGKTLLGLYAIHKLRLKSLIVVPTIDLLRQWKEKIMEGLNIPEDMIGIFGGGKKEVKPVTIITYDSAYTNVHNLADKHGLLIFDETHHLPSTSYRKIAECHVAWKRMGLTATPKRTDELHKELDYLVGPIVYHVSFNELAREGYVAEYVTKRIYIDLTPKEMEEYDKLMKIYDYYIKNYVFVRDPKEAFRQVVLRSRIDRRAHEALLAREKARQLALNAEEKIKKLEELLEKHKDKKVLIFSRYTDIVNDISSRLLIPKITHKTPEKERKIILKAFKEGKITKLVTGEVLDEGIDVPDASVGIIISGTGSERQYIQRLGRILRPKEEEAILIELITRKTIDVSLSKRRKPTIN